MDSLYFTYWLAIKPIEMFSEILNIMIRRIYCLILLLFFSTNLSWSQNPVNWSLETERIDEKVIELTFTATIEKGWYTYSQFIGDEGPIPTTIEFESTNQRIEKKSTESTSDPSYKFEGFDEMFDMDIIKYKHDFTIKQQLVFDNPDIEIQGYLTYMTCDDTRCLPPTDYEFSFLPSNVKAPNVADQVVTNDTITDNMSTTVSEPVQWNISYTSLPDQQFKIVAQAEIAEGWYVYSQENDPNDGPIPTSIFMDDTSNVTLVNKTERSADPSYRLSGLDLVFDTELIKYKKQFLVEHVYKVTDTTKIYKGFLEYMTCDDTQCMPPTAVEIEFGFGSHKDDLLLGTVSGDIFDPSRPKLIASMSKIDSEVDVAGMSLWTIFILGFGGGLLALLTPCVFPMIPMTVSLFSKGKKDKKEGIKNAVTFGASIIVIYVALGLIITMAFGENALNQLSTHWLMNLIFFLLFTIFAFSFFGYFEIQLPSSWVNKADKASSKGGLIGTFFGAFSIALVSFSCTGPIVGTLLVQAAVNGGVVGPTIGMLGFSVALALPFTLFAAFPSWLQSLPNSGSWMTSMKVILGFIELALGLKFLSTADLTEHWGILPYELFVGLWAIIFVCMTLYLFGLINFPHDNPNAKISAKRKGLGVFSAALTISVLSGFLTNPQTNAFKTPFWLSGLAPSACYSYIKPCHDTQNNALTTADSNYIFSDHCPPGINKCFDDYDEALKYASEKKMPILVDFTGYGCVNCRKMEENVWIDPEVNKILNEDYILVSLYVDDRKKLDKVLKTPEGTKIRNVGNKWAQFQKINFKKSSQPYYVLISADETVLNKPVAYTPDISAYKEFLKSGLVNFNNNDSK